MLQVDDSWVRRTLDEFADGFATRNNVPVHCNQWGVKDEVADDHGRLSYARSMVRSMQRLDSPAS